MDELQATGFSGNDVSVARLPMPRAAVPESSRPPSPAVAFASILFPTPFSTPAGLRTDPPYFRDLNLDQLLDGILAGREEYDLRPIFLAPLREPATVVYRQEIVRDLDDAANAAPIRAFAVAMRAVRRCVETAAKMPYLEQRWAWQLEAAEGYCAAVTTLAAGLRAIRPRARGIVAFRDHVLQYLESTGFQELEAAARRVCRELDAIRYCFLIRGSTIHVRHCEGEPDYAAEVAATFAKFSSYAAHAPKTRLTEFAEMNHIEAAILGRVRRLFPAPFAALRDFCECYATLGDERILTFDREVQFYLAYLDYIAPLRRAGLGFATPQLSVESKSVRVVDTFDLALAAQLLREGRQVVANDVVLDGNERILVVTGPNQGGKTTFARLFGQLHYLARLGLPVPGREAALFLCDQIFTHFERGENIHDLRGKLEDDLKRIAEILREATADSVIVLNEIFTSTSLQDAVALSRMVLARIIALDALGVCVTFIDELATLGPATVSMVSTVAADDPGLRTYRVLRRPADGLAYAMTVVERYRLTPDWLQERIVS